MHLGPYCFFWLAQETGCRRPHGQFADPSSRPGAVQQRRRLDGDDRYSLQVYCDFSGYTDMALGTATCSATSCAELQHALPQRQHREFWRRWHISLSSWLRDYIFIRWRQSRPVVAYRVQPADRHDLRPVARRATGPLSPGAPCTGFCSLPSGHSAFRHTVAAARIAIENAARTALCVLVTFLAVCAGWVFFRSATSVARRSCSNGWSCLPRIGLAAADVGFWLTVAAVAAAHFIGQRVVPEGGWPRPGSRGGLLVRRGVDARAILAPGTSKAFIYFQF